ncbi:MAG: Gfo/Idh/MocA family oxidoreductase [Ruminococcaceae bacterium]|nr:Gfo/Idh/MocA family oxidoreductase [Oscillospiraceae bacterium]
MLTLGIIGFGNMGTGHAKNILAGKCPEIKITAVADLKEARIAEAKKMFAEAGAEMPEFFSSGEELLAAKKCESVIICVPHYGHVPFAVEAFAKGYHVMVEKPAGVCTADVRVMNKAAKESGKVFGMMFNQRTNCVYRKIKEMIDSGELGAMRRFNWIITSWYRPRAYYDSGDWRATWSGEGGGVLLNQCPHQLDLWQWFCGMPRKISANLHFGKWHDIEVEDDVTAYAEYENGATAVFVTSTGDYPGTNRLEITFDKGKLVAEGKNLTLWKLPMAEQEFSAVNEVPFGTPGCEKIAVELDGENPQHPAVLNAFADAVLRGGKLIADGEEGINGLMLSNAMHLSAWTGKPVEFPFDEELFKAELMKRVATSRRKTNVKETFGNTEGTY